MKREVGLPEWGGGFILLGRDILKQCWLKCIKCYADIPQNLLQQLGCGREYKLDSTFAFTFHGIADYAIGLFPFPFSICSNVTIRSARPICSANPKEMIRFLLTQDSIIETSVARHHQQLYLICLKTMIYNLRYRSELQNVFRRWGGFREKTHVQPEKRTWRKEGCDESILRVLSGKSGRINWL